MIDDNTCDTCHNVLNLHNTIEQDNAYQPETDKVKNIHGYPTICIGQIDDIPRKTITYQIEKYIQSIDNQKIGK